MPNDFFRIARNHGAENVIVHEMATSRNSPRRRADRQLLRVIHATVAEIRAIASDLSLPGRQRYRLIRAADSLAEGAREWLNREIRTSRRN